MSENESQDVLGEPKKIIIVTELPARRRTAGEMIRDKTWRKRTVWRLTLLTPSYHSTMRCHSQKEVSKEIAKVLGRKRVHWGMRERTRAATVESIVHRLRRFAGSSERSLR